MRSLPRWMQGVFSEQVNAAMYQALCAKAGDSVGRETIGLPASRSLQCTGNRYCAKIQSFPGMFQPNQLRSPGQESQLNS